MKYYAISEEELKEMTHLQGRDMDNKGFSICLDNQIRARPLTENAIHLNRENETILLILVLEKE